MTRSEWEVPAAEVGTRLDRFLASPDRIGSRSRVSDALARGKIFLNDREATTAEAGLKVSGGDRVMFWVDRPGTAHRRATRASGSDALHVVYEDDTLIVVDKPAGLLTVPLDEQGGEPSVQNELVVHLRGRGKKRPLVVHRIDRDTSGLVIFATRGDAQQRLKDQFRRREPERRYLAVVYGVPSPESGTWVDHLVWDQRALIQRETHPKDPLGKEARSEYRVVETLRGASLVEVRLITGRRNQIRLQARLRGHTLVGEQRYIFGPAALRGIPFPRQALHAWRLAFAHPVTSRPLSFEAPIPDDMAGLLTMLRGGSGSREAR
jgi:23S rRNA pseudouridine1911/1915/1917 synthase